MENAKRDENDRPTILGVSENDGVTTVIAYADSTTHSLVAEDGTTGSDNGNNLANAMLDENGVPVWTAVSSADGETVIEVYFDPLTHALLMNSM